MDITDDLLMASDSPTMQMDTMPGLAEHTVEFPNENVEELLAYVKDKQTKSTEKKTEQIWQNFCEFVKNHRSSVIPPEKLQPEALDAQLGSWIMSLKKKNGQDYEIFSIITYYGCVKRKLEQLGYSYDIGKDPKFKLSRQVLSSKKIELKKEGKATSLTLLQLWVQMKKNYG